MSKKDEKEKKSKGFKFYNLFRKTRGFERTSESVPPLVTDCIEWLRSHNALMEEGLFRVPGSATQIREIKSKYDKGKKVDLSTVDNVHTVAGVLKVFFRELPEPLLTFELYESFLGALQPEDLPTKLEYLREVILRLPPGNRLILQELIGFLKEVSQHSAKNCMTSTNLAIVFAPNLIRPRVETMDLILANSSSVNMCIQLMIYYYEHLFLGVELDKIKDEEISLSPHLISLKQAQQKLKGGSGSQETTNEGASSTAAKPEDGAPPPKLPELPDIKNAPRRNLRERGRTVSTTAIGELKRKPSTLKTSGERAKRKKERSTSKVINTGDGTSKSPKKKAHNRKSFYDTLKLGTIQLAESLLEEQSLVLEIEEIEKLTGEERKQAEAQIKEKLKKELQLKKEHKKNARNNRRLRSTTFVPLINSNSSSSAATSELQLVEQNPNSATASAPLPPPILASELLPQPITDIPAPIAPGTPTIPDAFPEPIDLVPSPLEESEDVVSSSDSSDLDDDDDEDEPTTNEASAAVPTITVEEESPQSVENLLSKNLQTKAKITEVVDSVLHGDMHEFQEFLGEMKHLPRVERQRSKKALLARISISRQTAMASVGSSDSIVSEDSATSDCESEEDTEPVN